MPRWWAHKPQGPVGGLELPIVAVLPTARTAMRSCCCNAATPGLVVRADDLLGRERVLVMLAEEGPAGSAQMAQDQWLIGRPGTGERKVGSRDIAKEPT